MSMVQKRDLKAELQGPRPVPFMGVYDLFSASLVARQLDCLFLSGFSFAASHYGLPDMGYIAWPDMVDFARRIATVLPHCHLLVDIDDGYVDTEVACLVTRQLESAGVSAVLLEDQQRPRICGHVAGKQILPLEQYLAKLQAVLASRRSALVVARTDATDPAEIRRRVKAFAAAGADVVLVDAISDLAFVRELRDSIEKPMAFNQIAGGRSPACTLTQLQAAGVSLVIYSTVPLFAAQSAITTALAQWQERDGMLDCGPGSVGVKDSMSLLMENVPGKNP